MQSLNLFYPESRFGGFTDIDGTVAFFSRVNALIDSSKVVLDLGCGRGVGAEDPLPFRRELRVLRGKAAKVIGIDVDPVAAENPFIDEFHHIEGDTWPVEADSVDVIVCDTVVEHIENTQLFFSEISRVLKDGGILCIRTPNRWSYFALAATIIPNKFHARVTAAVQDDRKEEDVFPTLYRCNTVGRLRRTMQKSGFDCVVYGYAPEPSYLSFSKIAYCCGVMHQRFAPGMLKAMLFAFGTIKKR